MIELKNSQTYSRSKFAIKWPLMIPPSHKRFSISAPLFKPRSHWMIGVICDVLNDEFVAVSWVAWRFGLVLTRCFRSTWLLCVEASSVSTWTGVVQCLSLYCTFCWACQWKNENRSAFDAFTTKTWWLIAFYWTTLYSQCQKTGMTQLTRDEAQVIRWYTQIKSFRYRPVIYCSHEQMQQCIRVTVETLQVFLGVLASFCTWNWKHSKSGATVASEILTFSQPAAIVRLRVAFASPKQHCSNAIEWMNNRTSTAVA